MDAASLVALCLVLSGQPTATVNDHHCSSLGTMAVDGSRILRALVSLDSSRNAVARVAFAEAANQGDSGLAAVIYTILNRLVDGRWGDSIDDVLNAPHQFEPVARAGGDWRRLRTVSNVEQTRIDTIINLIVEGRLPDLTGGARYFQNPELVARRAELNQVRRDLLNFGGAEPSAVIGAHRFYVEAKRGGGAGTLSKRQVVLFGRPSTTASANAIFVGENRSTATSSKPDPRLRPDPDVAAELEDGSGRERSDLESPNGGASIRP